MRIPTYTAQGGATTEAPGRRLNVRMNAQPFVQAALQQGQAVAEVANQVGEYAATRYKIITENNLNEALLGAEETLRTRADELAKSPDYKNALDGDDPIWSRDVEAARNELRDRIGGNRYALQQFDARFGQIELTQRFALRGVIDRKIEAEARAAREQNLRRFADTVANGDDLGAVDLATRSIGIDSSRWAAAGAGNFEALTAQELAALKSGAFGAVQRLVDNSPSPERILDNLRVAIREDDITKAGAEGLYAYAVLQRLPYSDRQAILSSLSADVAFFNAPTEEEKAAMRAAEFAGKAAGDQAAALMDQLSSGTPVPQDAVSLPRQQLETVATYMTQEDFSVAAKQVENLEFIYGVAQSLNRVANPENVRARINQITSSGLQGEGVAGIDTDRERMLLDFLTKYETNMNAAIEDGGLLEWARSTGAVPVGDVDMSVSAITANQTGLRGRAIDRMRTVSHFDVPMAQVPMFGAEEAGNIVGQIQGMGLEEALAVVSTIRGELDPDNAQRAIEDLRAAGLPAEYVEMMYQSNPTVQRELVQISSATTADLKQGLDATVSDTVRKELATSIADYRVAFVAGGSAGADKIFNEQYAVAEKLALFRIRRTGQSAAEAVTGVVEDMFPPRENWLSSNNLALIVPRGFEGGKVEVALEAAITLERLRTYNIVPLNNPTLPEFADLEKALTSLADTGVWLNNSTGDGVVLHYNINGQYIPAFLNLKDVGVRPFEIKFKDTPSIYAAALESGLSEFERENLEYGAMLGQQAIGASQ